MKIKLEKYCLPLFKGFYGNSAFDSYEMEYDMVEFPFTVDDYDFDYKDYRKQVAHSYIEFVQSELDNLGFKIEITYREINSPKYYNYVNDDILVDYEFDIDDTFSKVRNYLRDEDNLEAFEEYIKRRFTSRDGFISFVSNDIEDWSTKEHFEDRFDDYLDFILQNELSEGTIMYMEYEIASECYLPCKVNDDSKEVVEYLYSTIEVLFYEDINYDRLKSKVEQYLSDNYLNPNLIYLLDNWYNEKFQNNLKLAL